MKTDIYQLNLENHLYFQEILDRQIPKYLLDKKYQRRIFSLTA
ncbi:hypothetical protein [Okeania sp. SIO1I7]|nr:hypothetical protein [Okeania sp. SIO1I7]